MRVAFVILAANATFWNDTALRFFIDGGADAFCAVETHWAPQDCSNHIKQLHRDKHIVA